MEKEEVDLINKDHTSSINDTMASFARQMPGLVETVPGLREHMEAKKAKPEDKIDDVVKGDVDEKKTVDVKVDGVEDKEDEPVGKPVDVELKGALFSKKKEKDVSFKDFDEVNAYVNKKYQVKDPEGYGKFLSNVEQWRNDSQKFEDVSRQFENVVNGLNSLPMEIQSAILAWNKGEDYRDTFKKYASNVDFTRDFGAHEVKDIMDHFFPGEFDDEDVEDYKNNPQVKAAYEMARKTLYPQAKKSMEKQRADIEREVKEQDERLRSTARGSVESLRESFPSMGDRDIVKVEKILSSGDDSQLVGLFKNADGSCKKDAAKVLAMALYGADQVNELLNVIEQQTRGMYPAVRNKPRTPEQKTTSPDAKVARDNELKRVIESYVPKKTY